VAGYSLNKTCSACRQKIRNDNTSGRCGKCRTSATGSANTDRLNDSLSVRGDAAELTKTTDQRVRTLADLIRVCEIDTNEWQIERWIANKWAVGAVDPKTGSVVTTPLFQVKAWLVLNRPVMGATARIAELVADAKRQIGPRSQVKLKPSGPHMLEVAIPDLHLGKLAWAPETGGANYDSKIAVRLFLEALDTLIARTDSFKFERVVFPVGHDFYHSDSKQGTTTKGTILDTDSRYHKSFAIGRRLISDAVDRLREIAPVTVVIVPGNHDALSSFHLGDSLACLYHKTPSVTVLNDPIPRKYIHYGANLILFTHGDKGKRQQLPLLMATEKPAEFGASRYREAHVGHTHELRVQEEMGVRIRISPALCPPDAWHSENHYLGNVRSAEALVWSRQHGNISVATYTVPESRDKTA